MTGLSIFFVGTHLIAKADALDYAFISIAMLRRRRKRLKVKRAVIDSGSFSTIFLYGGYPDTPEAYAALVIRVTGLVDGELLAVVTQDFMCEPEMLERTKARAVAERMHSRGFLAEVTRAELVRIHQRWTVKRYDRIRRALPAEIYLMPVLQGYEPAEYVAHLRMYGDRLKPGMWVGVGSVCKRNGRPAAVEAVLLAIKAARPDLLFHGFGVKLTALASGIVQMLLHSADSMAWSFSARKQGRDANDIGEAIAFGHKVAALRYQPSLLPAMMGAA